MAYKKSLLLAACIGVSGVLSSYQKKDCIPERTRHLICDSIRSQFTDSFDGKSKPQFYIMVGSLAKKEKLSKKEWWNNYYKCAPCELDKTFGHTQGGILVQMIWVNYRALPEYLFGEEGHGLDVMQKDPFTNETIFEYIDRRLTGDTQKGELPLSSKKVENFKWFKKELKKYIK